MASSARECARSCGGRASPGGRATNCAGGVSVTCDAAAASRHAAAATENPCGEVSASTCTGWRVSVTAWPWACVRMHLKHKTWLTD